MSELNDGFVENLSEKPEFECLGCGYSIYTRMDVKTLTGFMEDHVCPKKVEVDMDVAEKIMKDRVFSTGSRRDSDKGKPQMHRLMWKAIAEVSKVHSYGDHHYGEGNWRKGQPASVICDSAMRHLFAWMDGENYDGKSKLNHLLHFAWNALYLVWQFAVPWDIASRNNPYLELDDRMDYKGEWVSLIFDDTPAGKNRKLPLEKRPLSGDA